MPSALFQSINQLREFEPGRTYLWDLQFHYKPFISDYNIAMTKENLPAFIPTSQKVNWIPAESLSETALVLNSGDLTVGQMTYRFPVSSNPKEITINFMDDQYGTWYRWLRCWIEYIILCKGNGVNFLSECVDLLSIYDRLPTGPYVAALTRNYLVYPDGAISLAYTSDSGVKIYSVNFVVVGKV